ncbi:MAG: single stranded DNA-binding domain-containing protein [Candidatus Methanofastidiosia archaeon]
MKKITVFFVIISIITAGLSLFFSGVGEGQDKDTVVITQLPSTSMNTIPPTATKIEEHVFISILDLKRLQPIDKEVETKGIVTATPATFNPKLFYIQDDTGAGIQIYGETTDFFELNLSIGDLVEVKGFFTKYYDIYEIQISTIQDIKIVSKENKVVPLEMQIDKIDASFEGSLVKLYGRVSKMYKNSFLFQDATGFIKCYIDSDTYICLDQIILNKSMEIVGIIDIYKGEIEIKPRKQDDLKQK